MTRHAAGLCAESRVGALHERQTSLHGITDAILPDSLEDRHGVFRAFRAGFNQPINNRRFAAQFRNIENTNPASPDNL